MNEEQVKYMVYRFLSWRLPQDFRPDCGISFQRLNHPALQNPTGTNLFDYSQAEAMVRFMIEGINDKDIPLGDVFLQNRYPQP